jgi:hypothetical protein
MKKIERGREYAMSSGRWFADQRIFVALVCYALKNLQELFNYDYLG